MGIALALAGVGFTWGLWNAWQKAEVTRRWTPTPCRIVSARVGSERPTPNSNVAYRAEVRYRYEFGGQTYTGERIRRVEGATGHQDAALRRVQKFPTGMETTCWVNPASPQEAVLQHSSRAALYAIWFPMLFVVGGSVMAWRALRERV